MSLNVIKIIRSRLTIISILTLVIISSCSSDTATTAHRAVENSGEHCNIPEFPGYEELPTIDAFPDPFLSLDGSRISSKQQWTCRRAEIGAQVQHYELGIKPPKPTHVSGEFADNSIVVNVEEGGKNISFTAEIILPETGAGPFPAMIAIGRSSLNNEELAKLGVAIINFPNGDIGEQLNGESRGKGKFFELYGSDHSASAMMAWSWGVSRLIDALETTAGSNIDVQRLGVTGCSRNGKGALVVGAFDERIALTIAQESGSGGSASWRVSDAQKANGQNVQTLSQIVTENVWLTESFRQFSDTATKLPFDHHELLGMVAPRALLIVENTSMEWLGNISSYTTGIAAHTIWQSMGLDDHMGVSQVGGHNHCQYPDSQLPELLAYVQKFLIGTGNSNTNILATDGDFDVEMDRWITWDVPELN